MDFLYWKVNTPGGFILMILSIVAMLGLVIWYTDWAYKRKRR